MITDDLPLVKDTGEILKDVRFDWRDLKLKSIAVGDAIDMGKRAERISECSGYLRFAESVTHELRLEYASFCKDRCCPMCQRRRSLVLFHQVKNIAIEMLAQKPSTRFLMLTLTVPNCSASELSDTIKHMGKSKDRLFKRTIIKKSIHGWFSALEVTYNAKRDSYHPHFHILISVPSGYFTSGYIRHTQWLELWQESTRDPSITQVDVRTIKPNKSKKTEDAVSSSVAEVAKYSTKPSDYIHRTPSEAKYKADPVVVNVLAKALHGKRLVGFGGWFKVVRDELKQRDVESDEIDLVHTDNDSDTIEAVCYRLFSWNIGFRDYIG